jgi:hypothetical protein|tara:strand:- start:666 stop:911 length:246 start_codon:yes stop_codon:yes gene_type:complete
MDRTPVVSSNIKSIGYDSNSKILEVEFTNMSVYRYYEVPEDVYEELMAAESKGSYLHRKIKGSNEKGRSLPYGLYRYEQIE